MTTLPRPLLLLTALRVRASLRRAVGALGTKRGILVAAVLVLLVILWLAPAIAASIAQPRRADPAADAPNDLAPLAILGALVLSLIRSPGDRALAFLQAEVDLLFPAPFTRRQLLVYKLAQRVVPLLLAATLFSIWLRPLVSSWLAAWIGLLLTFWFLHLTGLCVALVGEAFDAGRLHRIRRLLLLLVVAAVVLGTYAVSRSMEEAHATEMLRAFARTSLGQAIALPALPFARTITAESLWPGGATWAGAAVLINVGLAAAALRLDANWLETSADSSSRLAQRLEELRRTGGIASTSNALAAVRVPMPRRLAGLGPLVWRQTLTGVRQGSRGLFLLLLIGIVALMPVVLGESASGPFRPVGIFLIVYVGLFMPQVLRLDFRGDIDRLDLLKSLPVSPLVVCLSEVCVPALLVSAIQVPLALALNHVAAWNLPHLWSFAPAVLFLNLLVSGVENLFFLLWPSRPLAGAGMQYSASQMVAQMLKMILLAVSVGVAVAVAVLATWPFGQWLPAIAAIVAAILAVECAAVIAITARLFSRFDPSLDAVPDA